MEGPAMNVAVATVKHLIETANEDRKHILFINRSGEVDHVSSDDQMERQDDHDVWLLLQEEAQARSQGPYFEILIMQPDGMLSKRWISGSFLHMDSDDDIVAAVEGAAAERTRFYEEREQVFEPSALPAA